MSPMMIAEVEREMKPMRPSLKSENPYFVQLMRGLPPRLIETKEIYSQYSALLKKLTLILVRNREGAKNDRRTREVIQGLGQYTKIIAELIEHYEKERFPLNPVDPIEMIEFLMEQHGLSQTDLAEEFGGQPVVSAVLAGKRPLNKNQILKLASRFHVNPAVFLSAD